MNSSASTKAGSQVVSKKFGSRQVFVFQPSARTCQRLKSPFSGRFICAFFKVTVYGPLYDVLSATV